MTTLDDLLTAIFDGQDRTLYAEFEGWARGSRRFRAFAEAYRTKIRAKLKQAHDEARLLDLRAEIATAALLLRDERFTLDYEKYAALKQRGPDFTVTFRTRTPFNVEVRRLRGAEWEVGDPGARIGKLMAVLADKVNQMPPSIVNLLWLVMERPLAEADLAAALTALRQLADRKVEDTFTRRGYASAASFLKQLPRLSGIVAQQPGQILVWLNPVARHPAPPEIVNALRRLDSG